MSAKTRTGTRTVNNTITRSRAKTTDNSQTDDTINLRKRKRTSLGDGNDTIVAPAKKYIAIGDTVASTSRKKPITISHKAVANPDLTKELKKLRKDYAQVQAENVRLKKHNKTLEEARDADAKKILLDADGLEEGTICEICHISLWTPFLLPDCGHTFCQSCIEKWFSQALAKHVAGFPDYDINLGVYHRPVGGQFQRHPSYACPKCREAVSTRPVENFSMKTLVQTITTAAGEKKSSKKVKKKGTQRKMGTTTTVWDRFFGKSQPK